VVDGRFELPPMANTHYAAFIDPSGGSSDSVTLAVVHREGQRGIVDAVREARQPFSEAVVAEFATLLKTYRIRRVLGDRFAGLWPRERFQVHGIEYDASARPKSDLYRDLLPIVNGAGASCLIIPSWSRSFARWKGGSRAAVATASIIRQVSTTTSPTQLQDV
jgi:hypothetical protein